MKFSKQYDALKIAELRCEAALCVTGDLWNARYQWVRCTRPIGHMGRHAIQWSSADQEDAS